MKRVGHLDASYLKGRPRLMCFCCITCLLAKRGVEKNQKFLIYLLLYIYSTNDVSTMLKKLCFISDVSKIYRLYIPHSHHGHNNDARMRIITTKATDKLPGVAQPRGYTPWKIILFWDQFKYV